MFDKIGNVTNQHNEKYFNLYVHNDTHVGPLTSRFHPRKEYSDEVFTIDDDLW